MQSINPPPSQTNPSSRESTYTVLTFQGKNYRILTRQHRCYLQMSAIWAVFWYLLGLALICSAIILKFQFKVLSPFMKLPFIVLVCFCCHLFFTIYAYRKRAHFTNSIYYSSINLLVWMVPVVVLGFLQIKQVIIPLCFYILIQTLLSFKYMTNKMQMVAKFLILMQAMMIALKADQKIQSPWKDVLFFHVVFFIFLSLCIIFMTAYLIYMKYIQNQQNLMKYKFTGALFIYLNTISFCLLSALPLLYVFLDVSVWIICGSMAIVLFLVGTFIYSYRKSIVIFFCTLNEIKSFNQIISFQPIESVNCIKPEFMNKNKEAKYQTMYLYRISQNWLTTSPQKATESQAENPQLNKCQQSQFQSKKMTDCTICLDQKAQVVWMPCGHLTVCMQCCSFMFQKRNMNCVLCKKTPQQIYIIDTNEKQNSQQSYQKNSQNQQKMKSFDTSMDNNDVSVISGSVMLEMEKKVESKKELISPKKKKNMIKSSKVENKVAFIVLEGYNVKIV